MTEDAKVYAQRIENARQVLETEWADKIHPNALHDIRAALLGAPNSSNREEIS